MTKRRIGTCALALLSASVVARSVPAEAQEEKKDVTWSLSGEARYRPEWRENTDLDSTREDQTRQGYMRLRLGVSILYKEDYRVFVQVQDARVAGEETSTGSNDKNLDLHQGYLEMKHLAGDRWNLIVGRQEWKYGDERLIGASWWSNVGRSFDGVKVRFAGHSYWIDGIAARIQTRPGPFGSPPVPATTGSDLFGLYGQCFARKGAEYEAYWLQYDDHVARGAVGLTAGRHYAQVKYHRFQLDQARDSWKDEAGVTVLGSDPTGQSGTSLGRELDLTWRFAWKEKTSFEAGYARFMPDRFARLTRGDDASDWAYVMLTATF